MIKVNKVIEASSLLEFNNIIRSEQEIAHGIDYCAVHQAIEKYMIECESYMELGVNQGATASTALLSNPKFIQLVDIDLEKYKEFLQSIAKKYAIVNGIELIEKECDSTAIECMKEVDMLFIDSYHKDWFMEKELALHGHNVNKYIIAHDTSRPTEALYHVLQKWAAKNNWNIIERGTRNVGYTVLKRG